MNEKMQYASMLELPVCTCNITSKPVKKKRLRKSKKENKVSDEQIKQEVLDMVNAEQEKTQIQEEELLEEAVPTELAVEQENSSTVYPYTPKKAHKFKVSIVGVQLVIIGFLVATILLTNAIYADSGINVFLRGVFGTERVEVDTRTHQEFSPIISMGDNYDITLNDGVITYSGQGSVYSPCDGVVSGVIETENGKFEIEIKHSENFKTVISDIERLYVSLGDKVYRKIPVGYLQADGATICFKNEVGSILEDYHITNNTVVWQE